METIMYTVYDSKGKVFQRPKYARNETDVRRAVEHIVNTQAEGNLLNEYPEDFEVYSLGTFDDQTGKFTLPSAPVHICRAIDLRRTENLNAPR